jgi:hypothetical protein
MDRPAYSSDRLVQLADSYVPVDVAETANIENPDRASGGIVSRMRDVGYEQTEAIALVLGGREQIPASEGPMLALRAPTDHRATAGGR